MRVVVTEGAAITVSGFKRVTIRNVEVSFGPQARGIQFGAGADGITIANASLRLAHAPSERGALPSAGAVAIGGMGAPAPGRAAGVDVKLISEASILGPWPKVTQTLGRDLWADAPCVVYAVRRMG